MCSQTMMSSVETLQGFKVTKAFFFFSSGSSGTLHQGLGREQQPGTPETFTDGGEDGCEKKNKCRDR